MMEYKRLTEKDWYKEKFYPKADNERVIRKRLWDLENKIEQGTLIELPCPVRTIVYYIASYEKKIGFWGKTKYRNTIMEIPFELDMLETYGNNWFLTREEAEKRLKELQE